MSLGRPSRGFAGFPCSLGGAALTAPPLPEPPGSLEFGGGFPASAKGLEGLPCGPPGGGGLGTFFIGGLSLRRGGTAPGLTGKLHKEGKQRRNMVFRLQPSGVERWSRIGLQAHYSFPAAIIQHIILCLIRTGHSLK